MVKPISIGVFGIQGAVSEHVTMTKQACIDAGVTANVYIVKDKTQLDEIQGAILPGGESTTISQFLQNNSLTQDLRKRVKEKSLAIMGTCAGCILLAKHILDKEDDVHLLKLMDFDVRRNAFGRQRESFEQNITINGWNEPFPAVFIRAPLITNIGGSCQILAQINSHIVMVEEENMMALSFHPELTSDSRIHQYFLSLVEATV